MHHSFIAMDMHVSTAILRLFILRETERDAILDSHKIPCRLLVGKSQRVDCVRFDVDDNAPRCNSVRLGTK
eukprot:957533-Amphidinium_carterae.1